MTTESLSATGRTSPLVAFACRARALAVGARMGRLSEGPSTSPQHAVNTAVNYVGTWPQVVRMVLRGAADTCMVVATILFTPMFTPPMV